MENLENEVKNESFFSKIGDKVKGASNYIKGFVAGTVLLASTTGCVIYIAPSYELLANPDGSVKVNAPVTITYNKDLGDGKNISGTTHDPNELLKKGIIAFDNKGKVVTQKGADYNIHKR